MQGKTKQSNFLNNLDSLLKPVGKKKGAEPSEQLDAVLVTPGAQKSLTDGCQSTMHSAPKTSKTDDCSCGLVDDEDWLFGRDLVSTSTPPVVSLVSAPPTPAPAAKIHDSTALTLVPAADNVDPTASALAPGANILDKYGRGALASMLSSLQVSAECVTLNINFGAPQGEENAGSQETARNISIGSFQTLGLSVTFMYVLLIIASSMWGYILSYLQQNKYLWIVQGLGVWSIMTTMHYYLKATPSLTLAVTLLACWAAFGMIEDPFVETKIETRFNYPVTQKMEYIGTLLDHSYSILAPAFALRKIVQDCLHDLRSQRCLTELKEGQGVMNVTMMALHVTLQDKNIVEREDVVIQRRTGESMVISFNETVNVPPNFQFPTLPEHDFHQMKLCAIMAMRLKNGNHYFNEYNLWLSAEKNAKSWMEWIEEKCMYAGFFDIFVRNQNFFGYWSQIKFVLMGVKKLIEFVAPDQLGVEKVASWLVASKTIKHPDQYVDMCTIDRCHDSLNISENLRLTQAILSQNVAPVVLPTNDNTCSTQLSGIEFDMENCPYFAIKCMEGFNKYGNRYAPLCPEHCRDALFLSKEDSIKRSCSVNYVIYNNHTQSDQSFIGGSQEEQSYTKYGPGKLNKIFKTILDYAVKMTGGVFLACAHGGMYIRMMR